MLHIIWVLIWVRLSKSELFLLLSISYMKNLAVDAVQSEPVSVGFPCFTGKLQGNLAISTGSVAQMLHNELIYLVILVEFPARWNREFLKGIRKILRGTGIQIYTSRKGSSVSVASGASARKQRVSPVVPAAR